LGAELPGAAGGVIAFGGVGGEGRVGGGVEDVALEVLIWCGDWLFYSWHDCGYYGFCDYTVAIDAG